MPQTDAMTESRVSVVLPFAATAVEPVQRDGNALARTAVCRIEHVSGESSHGLAPGVLLWGDTSLGRRQLNEDDIT